MKEVESKLEEEKRELRVAREELKGEAEKMKREKERVEKEAKEMEKKKKAEERRIEVKREERERERREQRGGSEAAGGAAEGKRKKKKEGKREDREGLEEESEEGEGEEEGPSREEEQREVKQERRGGEEGVRGTSHHEMCERREVHADYYKKGMVKLLEAAPGSQGELRREVKEAHETMAEIDEYISTSWPANAETPMSERIPKHLPSVKIEPGKLIAAYVVELANFKAILEANDGTLAIFPKALLTKIMNSQTSVTRELCDLAGRTPTYEQTLSAFLTGIFGRDWEREVKVDWKGLKLKNERTTEFQSRIMLMGCHAEERQQEEAKIR